MTCQRCDASAVPRSVTVGPYGSAVWWLATLYSSSYGHHGLRPCSTDIGQGALQVLWSVGPVTAMEITGRGRGHVHRGDRCGHRLPTGGGQEQPSSPQHELLVYLPSGKLQHCTASCASHCQAIDQLYNHADHHSAHGASLSVRAGDGPCKGYGQPVSTASLQAR